MLQRLLSPCVLAGLLFGALALSTSVTEAQTVNRKGKPFPTVDLPQNTKGSALPSALGSNLSAIADWYGQTDADFQALTKRDKHLAADRKGRLHYVCSILPAQGLSSGWGTSGTSFQAPYPDTQTFQLHSKPGATKVIYLDFDGNTTSGTAWNTAYTNGKDIVTPPYDIDGNPASFSSTELANIQLIWQVVAEDFAPFDVDVTTQDPGVEALRKTSPTDQYYGIRVCVGGSSQDWLKSDAGGVAYLGSFDWNSDTPVFVFPAQLGGGDPKFVAEAASHEAGHTFGLHHDGQTNGTEYFAGQGNWAPIMGVGYYVDVVQWSKGEYAFANNQEDDLAIISSYLPYRTDAVGNDLAHATALSGSTLSASGLVETTGDVDVFGFSTGTGTISLTAKPAAQSGNLNLLFSLYNSAGTLIASVGPTTASSGLTLSTSLNAGSYYLAVNGVGGGDPASTGFSNYASIGQFSISGNVVPSTNKAPTAVASNSAPLTGVAALPVNFSSTGSADTDGTIASYQWNFGDGSTSTAANPSHTYVTAGTYTASLVVYDNYGAASAPATATITAKANQAPVAKASATPTTGPAPVTVAFSSTGSADVDGTIAAYAWDFGDGTSSIVANPSHIYSAVGTYTAKLVVTDDKGLASAPASVTVTVNANQAPVAMASATPTTGTGPLAVTFSSTGSKDADGTIASYSWNFGDGTSSTAANPAHTYTTAGTYTATLRVTDNLGLVSAPVSILITVKPPPSVYIAGLTVTKTKSAKGTSAVVVATVKDQTGAMKGSVTVAGSWSGGLVSGTASGKTGSTGTVKLTSAATTKVGTITFTATGLTLTGYTYNSSMNTATSISIAVP